MNKSKLKNEFPETYKAVFTEGFEHGKNEGETIERERIRALMATQNTPEAAAITVANDLGLSGEGIEIVSSKAVGDELDRMSGKKGIYPWQGKNSKQL